MDSASTNNITTTISLTLLHDVQTMAKDDMTKLLDGVNQVSQDIAAARPTGTRINTSA